MSTGPTVQYMPAAACQPSCGLMRSEAMTHTSMGDTVEELVIMWMFWRKLLIPAFTVQLGLMENLAERRNSGIR